MSSSLSSAGSSAEEVQRVFLNKEATVAQHGAVFAKSPDTYATEAVKLVEKDVGLSSSAKARAGALCWRAGRRDATERVMAGMSVLEVLSMVKMLDCDRQLRQLDRRLTQVRKRRKRAALQTQRKALVQELQLPVAGSSATSALFKRVRAWVGALSAEALEFNLLNFPVAPWKELADLAHLKPADFALEYFLAVVFGAKPPAGTLMHAMSLVEAGGDLVDVLRSHPQLAECYSFLRTKFGLGSEGFGAGNMGEDAKRVLAATAPLSDVIWFLDELDFPGLDDVVGKRLASGEAFLDATGKGRDSFGKLLQQLLALRKRNASFAPLLQTHVEAQLQGIRLQSSKQVAVLGDASSSMQVAVESATIIGAVICSMLEGSLTFFNGGDFRPQVQPRTVEDVLAVSDQVRARGSTAPAASLYPFLRDKKKVDVFVCVTDEEENTDYTGNWCGGYRGSAGAKLAQGADAKDFAGVFESYLMQVNPGAKVFFVSFLRGTEDPGQMMRSMEARGLAERCQQFRFHRSHPDLSKLSNLLGLLAVEARSDDVLLGGADVALEEAVAQESRAADAVPIFCVDGTLNVTPEQAEAVNRAFTDTDNMTMDTLKRALPKLRGGAGDALDENASVSTDWSLVSKQTKQP